MRAILHPGQERRIESGHLWVYQGNIAELAGESGSDGAGARDLVDVYSARGRFLGRGYYNPASTIAIRLLTRAEEPIDRDFFLRRFAAAAAWRTRFFPQEASYRLVYSEGDLLPGLIVDRYRDAGFGDVLVVQFLTRGMDVRRDLILSALCEAFAPAAIVERSDAPSRRLEGLEPRSGTVYGALPDRPLVIEEHGLSIEVDVAAGQKTGYFFDQKENREALAPLVAGAGVLDAFCHTGSFALHAAAYGARHVFAFDQSAEAVEIARRNAARNGFSERCEFAVANAFDLLRAFERQRRSFDVVILDPPAFAKGKASVEAAVRGYKEINLRAIKLLAPGGFLITCSCSHHIGPDLFFATVHEAAVDARRRLRLVESRTQAKDHPILPGLPETAYLKCLIFAVV